MQKRSRKFVAILLTLMPALCLHAQGTKAQPLDLGLTYQAQRALSVNSGQSFWLQGGNAELGADAWHGLGAAFSLSGSHTTMGSSSVPLSMVVWTAGPRYRWHNGHRLSLYAEALGGEANGFDSVFPASRGAQSEANSFAFRTGFGVDYRVRTHLALRLLDASYLRTGFSNATNNTQHIFQVGAGVVVRFH
ncbi:MAG: outer membrane beta-barrel protein [Acidobacteriaceae bacterium]|nr:outer membrane beta-barrel protein [Acidobacteriaceae bacterium]